MFSCSTACDWSRSVELPNDDAIDSPKRLIKDPLLLGAALLVFLLAALAVGGWIPRRPLGSKLVPKRSLVTWEGEVRGSARAEGRFELVNEGNSPVRILGVESGCGCLAAAVDRNLVMPDKAALVSVSASVTPSEPKDVRIKIHTDSTIDPDVDLTFRVAGRRKPPFLLQVSGAPTLIDDSYLGGAREIIVETVEATGENKSPELRRTKENNWSTWRVSEARPWESERVQPALQSGRTISPGSGGAMVTDHLGKLGRRVRHPSNIFLSALLRRTPLLYVVLTRSTCGCLPA